MYLQCGLRSKNLFPAHSHMGKTLLVAQTKVIRPIAKFIQSNNLKSLSIYKRLRNVDLGMHTQQQIPVAPTLILLSFFFSIQWLLHMCNWHSWKTSELMHASLQIFVLFFQPFSKYEQWIVPGKLINRPIYIGKNQNPKNLGFLLYRLHCQKNL